MKIRSIIEEHGLVWLVCIAPLCWLFGHDYNIGRRCIRCHNPKDEME